MPKPLHSTENKTVVQSTAYQNEPQPFFQRKCTACEKEEKEALQRKETAGHEVSSQSVPSIVSGVLGSGGGRPLDAHTRLFMEDRFGSDFGQVRIHTGGQAAESAAAIQARAYTSGKDIVFGEGEYRPESEQGRHLLAHELVHVQQQNSKAGSGPGVQKFDSDEHRDLGDVTGRMIDIGDGVQLTFGQVLALAGDEFGSVDQLIESTQTTQGRAMIRAHLERAGIGGTAVQYLPAPTDDQKTDATKEYALLAFNNVSHFAAGGTALQTWEQHHNHAIDLAIQAGIDKNPVLLNRATLVEAFGQHFLTDAFSSGHMRVPRKEIIEYYTTDFAPRVFDHMISHFKERLIDEIYDQVDDQTIINEAVYGVGLVFGLVGSLALGLGTRKHIRNKIEDALDEKITAGFNAIGGKGNAIQYLGLGLAGIISGAMHDMENEKGLWVISDFQSIPWQAYGDGELDEWHSWEQKGYIEQAVLASAADIDKAYMIGVDEGQNLFNLFPPQQLPGRLLFGFNSDELMPLADSAVFSLANYLQYHPDTEVQLIGHTDPIGHSSYNEDLALRRAERVASHLNAFGVPRGRMLVSGMGERLPVTLNPRRYYLNRRVDITYTSVQATGSTEPSQIAYDNAHQKARLEVGPPFAAEAFLPKLAAGLNNDLPDWRWGSIPDALKDEMANYLKGKYDAYKNKIEAFIDTGKALDDQNIDGYTIKIRPIVKTLLSELMANPIQFLGEAMGRKAGP